MKRPLFVVAAGLIAAGCANPVVENVSDTGLFGAGYADHDQSGVGPVLLLACVFAIAFVALRTCAHWIADLARDIASRPRRADLPLVLGVQLVAEYLMEGAERLVHGGTMSGASWIGGPLAFALAVHIAFAIVATIVLGRGLCALARTIATAARTLLDAIVCIRARGAASGYAGRNRPPRSVRHLKVLTGPRLGRAPPFAPTLA